MKSKKNIYIIRIVLAGSTIAVLIFLIYTIQSFFSPADTVTVIETIGESITEDTSTPLITETNEDTSTPLITETDEDTSTQLISKADTDEQQNPDSMDTTESTTQEDLILSQFTSEPLPDDIIDKITGKSYPSDCELPIDELRYLKVLYKDFNQETKQGEIICNQAIAEDLLYIFYKLYLADYPIEKIRLIDEYDADDERSMADNNTSCFCWRTIEGSDSLSAHALGLAIDINPLYNPYVYETIVLPANAVPYIDRTTNQKYLIDREDLCYQLFSERGFTWGGDWDSPKDYQHFERNS